jgi:nucleosome binding factor SPN SPT16 subunit
VVVARKNFDNFFLLFILFRQAIRNKPRMRLYLWQISNEPKLAFGRVTHRKDSAFCIQHDSMLLTPLNRLQSIDDLDICPLLDASGLLGQQHLVFQVC